jgi:hypothetical protein
MKKKQIEVKPVGVKPKSISEALVLASNDKTLLEDNGTYLEHYEKEYEDEALPDVKYKVCAVGGLFVMVASAGQIESQADDCGIRESMVKLICKEIPGACDPLPFNVWTKYHDRYDRMTKEDLKDNEESYNRRAPERNYIDLAESLFEDQKMSFKEIAKEFKKFGR